MTRQAAEAAGGEVAAAADPQRARERADTSAILLVTGDRGLAGAFNSQIIRAGLRAADGVRGRGQATSSSTRRAAAASSSLTFREREAAGAYTGFTDRPAYADAREIADDLMAAYVDGKVDRVEIFYNGYVSPLTQEVRRETLLPLQQATILEAASRATRTRTTTATTGHHALVEYEPDPEEILERLSPTTSRSRSTARCSSRPPPSTARA